MPDCQKSILRTPSPPRTATAKTVYAESQQALLALSAELQQLDDRLASICRCLPEPGFSFNALGEIRGAVECARVDLLADAIDTVRTVATQSESQLQRKFEERQLWQVLVAS